MSFITIDNITSINAELTNYCNAACPMCIRYTIDGKLIENKVNSHHTTLNFLQAKFNDTFIKKLKYFNSCGNFGDGAMNPECLQIYQWLRELNPKIQLMLHTNGGARNPEFWQALADIDVHVVFAIDGLEDTNHLYRRNVKWSKLIENVKSFIKAGGKASWEMLVFKHNESQIEKCREFSQTLGFHSFNFKQSSRWSDFDHEGNWHEYNRIPVDDYFLEKSSQLTAPAMGSGGNSQKVNLIKNDFETKKISCKSCDLKTDFVEIYLAANGDVSPCCWLGDLSLHESKNIISDYKKVNLHHSTLEEILKSDFFNKLDQGINGVGPSYRLHTCYATCGIN